MNKNVYRNFYFIKESVFEFFQTNKKYLFWSILAMVLGLSLGICVGIKNASCYSLFNLSDKIFLSYLTNRSFTYLFLRNVLYFTLWLVIILFVNNFSFLTLANYIVFAYLAFKSILNAIILSIL